MKSKNLILHYDGCQCSFDYDQIELLEKFFYLMVDITDCRWVHQFHQGLVDYLEKYKPLEITMDKKMRKVSRLIRKAENISEKAAKKNDKLADFDEKHRDPIIKKAKKAGLTSKKGKR